MDAGLGKENEKVCLAPVPKTLKKVMSGRELVHVGVAPGMGLSRELHRSRLGK